MDQAERLRALAKAQRSKNSYNTIRNKRIITVASGKGGVGKTNFSVNIAIALSKLNKKVMILDADLGMANIDVVCGLSPKYNLGHVINRTKRFDDVVMEEFSGIKIIPGVSGVEDLTSLSKEQQKYFFDELSRYEQKDNTGLVFIDIGAGMGSTVINFMLAGKENIIITTPEPTAMMDAYAVIKTIVSKKKNADISVVINLVENQEEALRVYRSMNMITKQFLNFNINYLGYIVSDKVIPKSVKQQNPFYLSHPHSHASKCIKEIALRILSREEDVSQESGIKNFFEKMSSFLWG